MPPPERVAGLDDFVKALPLAFPHDDALLGAEVAAHDLEQGVASAADLRGQALADHPAGLRSEQQSLKKRDKGKRGKDNPPSP
jgi:hypothetical protein